MAELTSLTSLMSPSSLKLLTASGKGLIEEIGLDVARTVVFNVLIGRNLRDSTEILTRRRISALNLALVDLFVQGSAQIDGFIELLPTLAANNLKQKNLSKAERWLAQWILGLNDKAKQNVLRGNLDALEEYRDSYIRICAEVVAERVQESGELSGAITLGSDLKAQLNWLMLIYLLNTIGAETLAIRGSEKSAYGKLFEKLILGSMLHILGFTMVAPNRPEGAERVYWLSSRGDKRESDATLLYTLGKAVKIDIGFIGSGNTEVSLDKVTRFEREIELTTKTYSVETIIIVDRIGKGSRIPDLAKRVGGHIVQMSVAYWIKDVAVLLHAMFGFEHPILTLQDQALDAYLLSAMHDVPLQSFLTFVGHSP